MLRFIAQRLVAYVVVLFFASVASFYLIHLLPGNPACVAAQGICTPAILKRIDLQLGLNKPIYEQYFVWLNHLLHGSFGTSFITGRPITPVILRAALVDIQLVILSQLMALAIAIPLAMRSARKPGGVFDLFATGTSFFLLAVPTFVAITLLVDLFALYLKVPGTTPYSYVDGGHYFRNLFTMLLPAFSIALGSFVIYYRVLRSDLISTYQEEFITLARAKGLSRRRIVWRHAFRPSSVALLGTAGLVVSGLVGGTFIVEFLTGIPGLGWTLIQSVYTSDYLTAQAIILVIATAVLLINLTVDLLFAIVDPRIARA